ncbi:hypothetical protein HELRODRAFT_188099 [Helobdella robusta]|uniref:Ig-like domain-containing protein n=1 Tax=Helobdella robusta TaxID=6412 RepID=T1FPM8_HELRO|nr:hypothetical protein HELRODRAFT_188099 [Helobdella robusta]ESO13076.1 hypothetical protein HELRODRAFT_188099 [Helobdella robusta]
MTVLEGSNVTVQCFFTGLPTPKVIWRKIKPNEKAKATFSGKNINDDDIHNFHNINSHNSIHNINNNHSHNNHNNSSEIIKSINSYNSILFEGVQYNVGLVTLNDSSIYECVGVNELGSAFHEIHLVVEATPAFKRNDLDEPQNVNATVGDNVTIPCHIHAFPPANITWYIDGEILIATNPRKYRLSSDGRHLTIRNLCKTCRNHYDGGLNKFAGSGGRFGGSGGRGAWSTDLSVIQCQGRNVHGEVWGTAYVNVLEPPASQTVSPETDVITVTCSATSDDSTPISILWYRHDHYDGDDFKYLLSSDDDSNNHRHENVNFYGKILLTDNNRTLTFVRYINDSRWWEDHVGKYSCFVSSGYSADERVFEVSYRPVFGLSTDPRLKISLVSLISSGISMGNASIAEYDDYEPSKYDEDGSFIGNYRTDCR